MAKEGTVSWLKDQIREMTREVNQRLFEVKEEVNDLTKQLKHVANRLRHFGSNPSIVGKHRGDEVGLGFRGKRKRDLETQYKELDRFLNKDIWTPKAVKANEDRAQRAYESFKANHGGDWTREKWEDFANFMGYMSEDLLRDFGYEKYGSHESSKTADIKKEEEPVTNESFIELFSSSYKHDIDLYTVMDDVYHKEIKGKGMKPGEAMNVLKKRIKELTGEIEEKKEENG